MSIRRWRQVAAGMALLVLGLALAACAPAVNQPASTPADGKAAAPGYANPQLLIEPAELKNLLNDGRIRIIDLRPREAYEKERIPGAVSVPSDQLARKIGGVDGMLIPADEFQPLLQKAGVNGDTVVIAYDADTGLWAARLFWGLEYYGHQDKVRVLNGGFAAWKAAGLQSQNGPVTSAPPAGNFVAKPVPAKLTTLQEIKAGLSNPDWILFDVRTKAEHTGQDVRAARGGHIPGAVNLDWQEALKADANGVKRWKSAAEIAELYQTVGLKRDKTIVPYCQTNVRGAHAYLTLRLMGYTARPYEGAWAEWGNAPDVPVETGEQAKAA